MSTEPFCAMPHDQVAIRFPNGSELRGRLMRLPRFAGDTWVVNGDDGEVTEVQQFELLRVLGRRVKHDYETTPLPQG